jgi:hypothetical protein
MTGCCPDSRPTRETGKAVLFHATRRKLAEPFLKPDRESRQDSCSRGGERATNTLGMSALLKATCFRCTELSCQCGNTRLNRPRWFRPWNSPQECSQNSGPFLHSVFLLKQPNESLLLVPVSRPDDRTAPQGHGGPEGSSKIPVLSRSSAQDAAPYRP